jgi:hypothetical protein
VTLQGTTGTDFAGLGGAISLTPGSPNSTAVATTSTIPGGTYGVSARYSGDSNYYSNTSRSINITIAPEPSQMVMGGISGGWFITSPLTLNYAEPVTLYVAVGGQSGNGHPTGTISLLVDGAPPSTTARDYQTPSTLTLNYGESATFFGDGLSLKGQSSILPNLSPGFGAGSHQVSANYPGDNSFNATQANYSFVVNKVDSIVADFFPLGTAIVNVPVTLAGQLVLANNSCAPYGGTVTITDYTFNPPVVLGSAQADQLYCDSYSIPVTFTTGGNHPLRVSFSGDSNVNASYSTYQFPVGSTTYSYVSLMSDVSSALVGQPVTLTAQVGSDVRQYVATGSVKFVDGSTTLGTATLDATGTATLQVSSLAPGTHNLSSNYSGDAVLQASSGGPLVVSVIDFTMQAQPTSLSIAAGQSGTATLSVLPLGGSTQTLLFSCANAPAGVSCAFSPATVTLDGTNPASVKMTVSANVAIRHVANGRGIVVLAGSLAFGIMLLPMGGKRCRRMMFMCLIGLASLTLYGTGCGSSSKRVTPSSTTYVLNVTASGNGAAKTTPLVVIVTQ